MPAGVKIAKVNYENKDSLVAALKGQEALVITMSVQAAPDSQKKLIEAAAAAGVAYVVPNGWGGDPDQPGADDAFLAPAQRAAQRKIEELGVSSWIQFVSGFWFAFSLAGTADRFGFDFQKKSVTFFGDGMAKINTSSWEQTGRAVAAVLSLPEKPTEGSDPKALSLSSFKNGYVYFSSFHISQRDMFDAVLRVTGDKESDWTVKHVDPKEYYQSGLKMMQEGNRLGFARAMYVRMFTREADGRAFSDFQSRQGLHNDSLGLPVEDLDEQVKTAVEMSADFV